MSELFNIESHVENPDITKLREELHLDKCRLRPYAHQVVGIQRILTHPYLGVFDEMGVGKSLQVTVAAIIMALRGTIDQVIIVAPASVRSVWFDPELGELSKHLWAHFPCTITEYHSKIRTWNWFTQFNGQRYNPKINFTITNYDFIRVKERIKPLFTLCSPKTLLVLDESSAIKNWRALQTKASNDLRTRCGRVVLLNGTPIGNNPGDLYSQAYVMNPRILACNSFFHFRARYAIMGGWQGKQIIAWRSLDDLQQRLAPYVIRRVKEQCLDLPPKIDSVPISVALTSATWKIYKEMKDDMVAWLNNVDVSAASQAIVKAIRLSQITSGFIGGVERQELDDRPDFIEGHNPEIPNVFNVTHEIGREKLDMFLGWLKELLEIDPNLKLLCWSRFRPEVKRLNDELLIQFPNVNRGMIWGGQTRLERDNALKLLDPRTMPKGPVVVVGTPASGSMGLNLAGAHTVVYFSNDYSLKTRQQSEDRVHRPGQVYPVSYYDMIATGPNGQKTIDHAVMKALKNKKEIANFTTSAWIEALSED